MSKFEYGNMRVSQVLRYRAMVADKGAEDPDVYLLGMKLLADTVTDPVRTEEEWDRSGMDGVDALNELIELMKEQFGEAEGN